MAIIPMVAPPIMVANKKSAANPRCWDILSSPCGANRLESIHSLHVNTKANAIMFLNFAARATARKSPPLTGVGDSAWWMGEDNLIVQDGGRHLIVRVTGPEATAERKRIAQTIGRTLVEGSQLHAGASQPDG